MVPFSKKIDASSQCGCTGQQTQSSIDVRHRCTTPLAKYSFLFILERKIVIIFLPINLNMCFGCSKEPSQSVQNMVPFSRKIDASSQGGRTGQQTQGSIAVCLLY